MIQIKDTTIEFSFYTDEIFDKVSNQTLYYAKSKKDSEGKDMTDNISISQDEKDFVLTELRSTINSLFGNFIKLTNYVVNSLTVNELRDDPEGSPGDKAYLSGFSITKNVDRDGKVLFNENRLTILDIKCLEYIVCDIILKWSKLQSLTDEVAYRTRDSSEITTSIQTQLFSLKKSMYNKSYSIIAPTL